MTPKFRAWDGKEYFYDVVPLFKHKEIILSNPLAGNKLHKVKKFEEFTGLKDINGKEIYEGDIVKETYSDGSGSRSHIIEFKEQEICIGETCGGRNHYFTYTGLHFFNIKYESYEDPEGIDCKNLEIIGNIYENKNLMVKTK